MTTKAVHLELVTDLTTEAFIAALTRFISRRGICSHIYCDCGTNFKGAANELNRITQHTIASSDARDKLQSHFAPSDIRFHFNPPCAPNFGGLWERTVQSVKRHLVRVIDKTILTLPEMMTLLTQIEAILNSRPLTPLSTDPQELDVLTPGHFLTGAPLVSIPEPRLLDVSPNRLSRWQQVQQFSQHLWKRWSLEYLHHLQQRHKWTKSTANIKIGDLVLLKTSTLPCHWPTGRISELLPGKDNIVRVVKVKTTDGEYIRPVSQVYPMPMSDTNFG
ncbi:uncharacterized protein LOC128998954 [Macrosteles quadrilineatus]|uniref:uncharacterized protein LOC128998954 n=1 Tax=Macrosteles quadrilineatus TaxID=74068 RepID=UPI0023E2DA01|nr:uncharacterized protein LOC128998954 [Macrosteles quadrilineatus]